MSSLERMYFDIQRDYAASIIRSQVDQIKTLGDFYDILNNKHLNPFLREISAPEIFKKQLLLPPAQVKTVQVDPKKSTAMIPYQAEKPNYQPGRYNAIRKNVVEVLKERSLTTATLTRLLRIRHGDLYPSYIHSMLTGMEANNIVYRIPQASPIIWALAS